MLFAVSGLRGCPVEASDGEVGAVKDFLFDDQTWKIRWMAVEAGDWLSGRRRVFIHPSAIAPLHISPKPTLPMMSSAATLQLSVNLARAQIEAGPHAQEDAPVTRDMEALLYDYYAWDPYWGASHFGGAASPNAESRIVDDAARRNADAQVPPLDGGDHLHSVAEFKDYYVHAVDGDIGHVENLLADDANWDIRYLVIATRNWWPGKVVQLSPYAVKDIDWFGEHINMNVTRDQVRSAPAWDPLAMTDEISEDEFHRHFGWAGYGGPSAS
jgi:hypothetical protein